MTEQTINKYFELKEKYPDAILLFRAGGFYEAYDTDAVKCANILGITLIKQLEMKMTAFPHYAIDTYLPTLIRAGFRVAICDAPASLRSTQINSKSIANQ